ncbi:uncharacterized protein LOC125516164 [Triticum urartu]|uniref:uncharacterized protein LOC125516164 n=1 Tax=Triticum urartu TaxID=4572 RepID=UPI0020438358|nr:uncharacterized protein LOC125516164 [Triticum urartu]
MRPTGVATCRSCRTPAASSPCGATGRPSPHRHKVAAPHLGTSLWRPSSASVAAGLPAPPPGEDSHRAGRSGAYPGSGHHGDGTLSPRTEKTADLPRRRSPAPPRPPSLPYPVHPESPVAWFRTSLHRARMPRADLGLPCIHRRPL